MSDTDATLTRHKRDKGVVTDVDEILEHVINANMLSMPYDVYTELFDAVDGLGVKVEKLEAENVKLREELEFVGHIAVSNVVASIGREESLEDENAKLRKIARLYIQAIKECGCDLCPHYDDEDCPVETYQMRIGCKLYVEMRELGIEVSK